MPYTIVVTPANVRAAIGADIEAVNLSDAIIALDIYSGAAIFEVQQKDPLWAMRTGNDQTRLNRAADYLTGARAVYAIPAIKSEKYETQSYDRTPLDPNAVAARLTEWAEAEIAIVTGETSSTDAMPTMFSLACGGRGA